MFERLTSILAKIGIQLHPSVIYREFTSQAPAPEIGLPDCTWEFAAAAEMQELAQVPAYGISLDELYERLGERAECFVLRHRGSIIAFTWCQLDGPPRPRFGLTFGPKDAYLFNAHTDPAFRGRNVLPFLRHQLYLELTRRGRTNLISRSEEHTSELQSLMRITYDVFCLKKKKTQKQNKTLIE